MLSKKELWEIWLRDPNEVERYMLFSTNTKKEEREVRDHMESFIEKTGIREKLEDSHEGEYRVMGQGLFHDKQKEANNLTTILGILTEDMSLVKEKKELFLNSNSGKWLKELFLDNEIEELFWLSKKELFSKIAKKIEELEDSLDHEKILKGVPDFLKGGVIQYLWNSFVKLPGSVIDSYRDTSTNNLIVVIDKNPGKFIGSNGKTIQKISILLNENISLLTEEELEE